MIPVFFILRASFEYVVDAIKSHTFGSDCMPAINFIGVLMHEVCLSVMITSIKHPLVFVSLVLSDVLENSFCLWSLARNVRRSSNRVSPGDIENEEESIIKKNKSLTRRSSNVREDRANSSQSHRNSSFTSDEKPLRDSCSKIKFGVEIIEIVRSTKDL